VTVSTAWQAASPLGLFCYPYPDMSRVILRRTQKYLADILAVNQNFYELGGFVKVF
jgi:hypothetical protein